MPWLLFLASLLVPGAGFLARRDVLTFAFVFVTVGVTYASYHVLTVGYPTLAMVPTSYHYLPVIGGALHLGAALRATRPDRRRQP